MAAFLVGIFPFSPFFLRFLTLELLGEEIFESELSEELDSTVLTEPMSGKAQSYSTSTPSHSRWSFSRYKPFPLCLSFVVRPHPLRGPLRHLFPSGRLLGHNRRSSGTICLTSGFTTALSRHLRILSSLAEKLICTILSGTRPRTVLKLLTLFLAHSA